MTPRSFVNKLNTPAITVPNDAKRDERLRVQNIRERIESLERQLLALTQDFTSMSTVATSSGDTTITLSGLLYQGEWDVSNAEYPSNNPVAGDYWIVSVAGSFTLNLRATTWEIGDWAVYQDDGWQKVANLRSITTNTVLGRGDAGKAEYEELVLDTDYFVASAGALSLDPDSLGQATPTFIPDGQTVIVKANSQMLYALDIVVDGSLIVDGSLVNVALA